MPGKILPTFTPDEVKSHNHDKSCYVTLGSKVFDVTDFIDDHPGGGDLVLQYAGKDVGEIMGDVVSHEHSEAAYEILDDSLVGFLGSGQSSKSASANGTVETTGQAGEVEGKTPTVYETTGMSKEEDLSIETDITQDYQKYKFLDLNKPLLMQLWNSGFSKDFYLEQIHRPRHYRGGESAPLFGNFLEPLSKTAWYVVPTIWLPCIAYGMVIGFSGMPNICVGTAYFMLGLFSWSLIEYLMHRFLFHVDTYDSQKYLVYRWDILTFCQAPSGQSSWDYFAFPPARHPSLLAHG